MDAKRVIEILTDDDVVTILENLGSKFPKIVRDGMLFSTICHNNSYEGKHKLHYHSESKTFYCYTECGNIGNIFSLVMKVKDVKFSDAYRYICELMGINIHNQLQHGFNVGKIDNSFIYKLEEKEKENKKDEIIIRNNSALKRFWDLYHKSWINDHIKVDIMKEFNIKFDIIEHKIIIPHYDINNNLIGIRCRHLKDDMVEKGFKYIPITIDNILYNYPTSMNLYGINKNKENIKKYKSVVIGESEKFVMQHKSFFENSTAVALNGSSLSDYQINLLLDLGVETVVLALDKEFTNDEEEKEYKNIINKKFLSKLIPLFKIEIIWDNKELLDHKDSPTDKGVDIYNELYKNRIIL